MAYTYTNAEKAVLVAQKDGRWSTDFKWSEQPSVTKTMSGLTFKVYTDPNNPKKIHDAKGVALKTALAELQTAGILWAQNDLKSFKVCFYQGGESRGVAYMDSTNDTKPSVALQLGTRASQHVLASFNLGEDAGEKKCDVSGGIATPARILADRLYDYYKPTITVGAKEKLILAQTFHEFGHVFHQLTNPTKFMLNGEVAQNRYTVVGSLTHKGYLDETRKQGKLVSNVASATAGTCLNEYVAEVFCGIMMGIHWSKIDGNGKIKAQYLTLGGAVPPTIPSEISRRQAFVAQKCKCDGSGKLNPFD